MNIQVDIDREIEFIEVRRFNLDQFGFIFSDGDGDSLEFIVHIKDLRFVCDQLKKANEVLVSWINRYD